MGVFIVMQWIDVYDDIWSIKDACYLVHSLSILKSIISVAVHLLSLFKMEFFHAISNECEIIYEIVQNKANF